MKKIAVYLKFQVLSQKADLEQFNFCFTMCFAHKTNFKFQSAPSKVWSGSKGIRNIQLRSS